MIIELARIKIDIRLNAGIYWLDNLAANGKTFIGKMLNNTYLQDKALYITYSRNDLKYVVNKINNMSNSVILVDRYDMYESNEINKSIEDAISRNCIVLIDRKWFTKSKLNGSFASLKRISESEVVIE